MSSVAEFLRTGRLGALDAGMSREDVRALLGEPEAVSDQRSPEIWKYGSLQLVFYRPPGTTNPLLTSITLYFHGEDERPPGALVLTGWMPDGDTTLAAIREHLAGEGIPVRGGVETGPDRYLVVGESVRVTFDGDQLYSISSTANREPKVKQFTVNIPVSELDTLRREAAAQGISISALCSRWIVERAAELQPH